MKMVDIEFKGYATEANARKVLEREAEAIGESKACVLAQGGRFYPTVIYPTAPGTNVPYLCARNIYILGA